MKLFNVADPQALLNVIDQCEGKVELVSSDGDRLNLKSKLCQYVALANIFAGDASIPELELIAYEPEDVKRLMDFMLKG